MTTRKPMARSLEHRRARKSDIRIRSCRLHRPEAHVHPAGLGARREEHQHPSEYQEHVGRRRAEGQILARGRRVGSGGRIRGIISTQNKTRCLACKTRYSKPPCEDYGVVKVTAIVTTTKEGHRHKGRPKTNDNEIRFATREHALKRTNRPLYPTPSKSLSEKGGNTRVSYICTCVHEYAGLWRVP